MNRRESIQEVVELIRNNKSVETISECIIFLMTGWVVNEEDDDEYLEVIEELTERLKGIHKEQGTEPPILCEIPFREEGIKDKVRFILDMIMVRKEINRDYSFSDN